MQYQLEYIYHEQNRDAADQEKTLRCSLTEMQKNIDSVEESYFIKKDMPPETYDKYFAKYAAEKAIILKEMENCTGKISNFEDYIKTALELASNLSVTWTSGDISIKEKLQKLVFPSGIYYNRVKQEFRTEKINSVFACIAVSAGHTDSDKKGTNHPCDDLSPSAGWTGLEPATSAVTGQHSNQLNYQPIPL